MADRAPQYGVGDLVSPLANSLVMTFLASGTILKGDPVGLTSTNSTDGRTLGTVIQSTTAGDAAAIGIAMDAPDANASPSVVPVIMHGVTKIATTAVAIAQGHVITASATASLVQEIAAPTTALILAGFLGFAITNLGASDLGYAFIIK